MIPPEGVGVGLYRSQLWSPFRDFRGSLHKAKLEVAEEMRVSCGKTCCCCQVTIEYIRIYIYKYYIYIYIFSVMYWYK